MGIERKKLASWLRLQMQSMETDTPVVRMVLKHALATGNTGQVAKYQVSPGTDPDSLCQEVEDAAQTDAEGLGGLQLYALCAYFKGNEDEVGGRFTFRIHVDKKDEDEVGLSEAPTQTGLLQQMMRHTEAMMRSSVMASTEANRILLRMNEQQAEALERLAGRHLEMLDTMEEVMGAKDERDLKRLEIVAKSKRDEQIMEKLSVLLPAVVNRLGGKKILPENMTPSEMMIGNLLGGLDAEQMGKLQGIFKPEQLMIVMELYDHFKKIDDAQKVKKLAEENAKNGQPDQPSVVVSKPRN